MRILLICEHTKGTDGWSAYTRLLAEGLEKKEHEVHCCRSGKEQGELLYAILPKPLRLLTNPLIRLPAARKLKKICEKVQPDVIHITVEPYAMMIPFLPKNIADRTILTVHGSYGVRPFFQKRSRWGARRYYRHIAQFITVSNYTKERVLEVLSEHDAQAAQHFSRHSHVIHNGIRLPHSIHRRSNETITDILLIGAVKPRKGVLEAIEACAEYRKEHKQTLRLSIIGTYRKEDPYIKQIRKRTEELHLAGHVELLGHASEEQLNALLERADLFLMPALTTPDTFEGFGLVYLEASARGIPCIGPNESGAKEAISEGVSGYHVDPKNPKQIAQCMHRILDEKRINPQDCRKWAEDHCFKKRLPEIERVYSLVHSKHDH